MKTAFVINGFNLKRTAAHPLFAPLRQGLKAKGYKVVAIDISWMHTTISQFVEKFKVEYVRHKTDQNIIIGNSFGAVVALIAAIDLKPDQLVLASLSPFFAEDVVDKAWYNQGLKKFGKKRMQDFNSYSSDDLAHQLTRLTIPTIMTFGSLERKTVPKLVKRVQTTARKVKQAKLIEIKGAPHSLKDTTYTQAILKLLS